VSLKNAVLQVCPWEKGCILSLSLYKPFHPHNPPPTKTNTKLIKNNAMGIGDICS